MNDIDTTYSDVEIIRVGVARIAAEAHDDETAHVHEDALHVAVLRAIAAGAPNAQTLAVEALKTVGLDFSRWCG